MPDREEIYDTAGLTQEEIETVEACLDQDSDGSVVETSAFNKLQLYFCETGEMPYAIATQSSWHPENTHAPDDWIVEYLTSV